jgi:hypothetical protein
MPGDIETYKNILRVIEEEREKEPSVFPNHYLVLKTNNYHGCVQVLGFPSPEGH